MDYNVVVTWKRPWIELTIVSQSSYVPKEHLLIVWVKINDCAFVAVIRLTLHSHTFLRKFLIGDWLIYLFICWHSNVPLCCSPFLHWSGLMTYTVYNSINLFLTSIPAHMQQWENQLNLQESIVCNPSCSLTLYCDSSYCSLPIWLCLEMYMMQNDADVSYM